MEWRGLITVRGIRNNFHNRESYAFRKFYNSYFGKNREKIGKKLSKTNSCDFDINF